MEYELKKLESERALLQAEVEAEKTDIIARLLYKVLRTFLFLMS